jgi:hypothetical protein
MLKLTKYLFDAPNKESIEKYHEKKYGIKCE